MLDGRYRHDDGRCRSVNAEAFIGGNAFYGLVNPNGSVEGKTRHNKAVEDLQEAQSKWNQERSPTIRLH